MDLKSMLNDSASRPQPPPRLHTSSSSISERPLEQHQPYDLPPERPTPHPSSSYAPDARGAPPGSYFPALSPQQHNSASTPSAGAQSAHSAYAQSPGPAQHFTPRRESTAPQHVYTPGHIPPPSPIGVPPSTPGSQYHPGGPPQYGQPYPPPNMGHQRQLTRDDYPQPGGRPSMAAAHQMSPPPPHHLQTPSTPLGPPTMNYARPPINQQRPPSQGYDHLRRSSISSMGSAHSRDPGMAHIPHAELAKASSIPRTYSSDEERLRQERERSVESVSPKTIPRPPPQRNSSHGHYPYEQSPAGSVTSHTSHPGPPPLVEQYSNNIVSTPIQQQSLQALDARAQQVSRPSPGTRPAASMTPQSTHSSIPPQPSPPSVKPPSKKRTASVISNAPPSSMPPIKRIKREEKPIWAQTARKKPLKLGLKGARARQPRNDAPMKEIKREISPSQHQKNGHAGPPAGAHTPPARPPQPPVIMDESILPEKPRNDLVYTVCEWIWSQIGQRTPPKGSVFEVEAKLGVIWDIEKQARLQLPVLSEAIFDRLKCPIKTKFDTSVMTEVAHKGLNDFLNHAIQWNRQSIANGAPRYPIEYTHPQEWDEYSELTPEGRAHLQHLAHWLNPNHQVKVRKTFDKKTQAMTAQIIKTRVADLEIYNPNDWFDYRISISLETPWDGPTSHLVEETGTQGANDRYKDRLSYKHRDYQIDLTQISHRNSQQHDHEVEIEINNDSLLAALDAARAQAGDRYEKCLGGFVDNIRILAGHASNAMQAAAAAAQQGM